MFARGDSTTTENAPQFLIRGCTASGRSGKKRNRQFVGRCSSVSILRRRVVASSRLAGPKAGLLVDQQHDISVTLGFVSASVPPGRELCQPEEVYIDALTAYGRSFGGIYWFHDSWRRCSAVNAPAAKSGDAKMISWATGMLNHTRGAKSWQ